MLDKSTHTSRRHTYGWPRASTSIRHDALTSDPPSPLVTSHVISHVAETSHSHGTPHPLNARLTPHPRYGHHHGVGRVSGTALSQQQLQGPLHIASRALQRDLVRHIVSEPHATEHLFLFGKVWRGRRGRRG